MFILRVDQRSYKLLGQGYVRELLKSSLRKFYGRYEDLIKHYEIPLSKMLHNILVSYIVRYFLSKRYEVKSRKYRGIFKVSYEYSVSKH